MPDRQVQDWGNGDCRALASISAAFDDGLWCDVIGRVKRPGPSQSLRARRVAHRVADRHPGIDPQSMGTLPAGHAPSQARDREGLEHSRLLPCRRSRAASVAGRSYIIDAGQLQRQRHYQGAQRHAASACNAGQLTASVPCMLCCRHSPNDTPTLPPPRPPGILTVSRPPQTPHRLLPDVVARPQPQGQQGPDVRCAAGGAAVRALALRAPCPCSRPAAVARRGAGGGACTDLIRCSFPPCDT